jgi:hypothetical protein
VPGAFNRGVEELKRYDVAAMMRSLWGKDAIFRAPDALAHNDAQAPTWSLVTLRFEFVLHVERS